VAAASKDGMARAWDVVSGRERLVKLGIGAVDGVEKARRLLAEIERGPDVCDRGQFRQLELEPSGPGSLAEAGEESHGDFHAPSV